MGGGVGWMTGIEGGPLGHQDICAQIPIRRGRRYHGEVGRLAKEVDDREH